LAEAKSDFAVFEMLKEAFRRNQSEECHALHYLQMTTEKLGKAAYFRQFPLGKLTWGHKPDFFEHVWGTLNHATIQQELKQDATGLQQLLDRAQEVRDAIYSLVPGDDSHKNVEYPWRPATASRWEAPCNYPFALLVTGPDSVVVYEFLELLKVLLSKFDQIFT
jgi:hypothetical protein